jgi:maleylpyruvate isomerase
MIRLHGYWRSTASYRVRIALALKGLTYDQATYDLRTGAQRAEEFRAINPQGLVPALEVDGGILTQSLAILEWLEERFPEPALLPESSGDRARARALAGIVCCDIHPLNNLRVLQALRSDFAADDGQVSAWLARWIAEGFAAIEPQIERLGGPFALGRAPGLVDCCLVPQVYAAERFEVELARFPAIREVMARCAALAPFRAAHPSAQADADRELA